ncbi:MAG: large-conductance mechanosensitive channel protein MscL [Phycisphaerales bacterium]|nr:large-conductance mechanosensitive channel protein MscL [Phycisphaerales bacterium]
MGMVKEFREFALKGNVLDLAVGVIIGAAFGTIVGSFIKDIIMPVVGLAGNVDFSKAEYMLRAGVPAVMDGTTVLIPGKDPIMLRYGNFVTVAINFIILAFCIFLVIKLFNTARRRFEAQPVPAPAVPPAPTKEQVLLTEIRDLLARR